MRETRWKGEPNRIGAVLHRNYTYELHSHDFYEVNIVMSGSGTHQIEERSFPVQVGDVFVIPPGVGHGYADTDGLDVYHLLFHPVFMERTREESRKVNGFDLLFEIEPFLRRRDRSCFLHLSPHQLLDLRPRLEKLLPGGAHYYPGGGVMRSHEALSIVYWLAHLLEEQLHGEDQRALVRNEQAVIRSLDYIHKNYDQKITVESLCERNYMSRSTFLRSFQAVCGMSPARYLREYRCRMAEQFLQSGALRRTEVAHECGFYDLSHMEKCLSERSRKQRLL